MSIAHIAASTDWAVQLALVVVGLLPVVVERNMAMSKGSVGNERLLLFVIVYCVLIGSLGYCASVTLAGTAEIASSLLAGQRLNNGAASFKKNRLRIFFSKCGRKTRAADSQL